MQAGRRPFLQLTSTLYSGQKRPSGGQTNGSLRAIVPLAFGKCPGWNSRAPVRRTRWIRPLAARTRRAIERSSRRPTLAVAAPAIACPDRGGAAEHRSTLTVALLSTGQEALS